MRHTWLASRDRRVLAVLAAVTLLAYLPVLALLPFGGWPFSDDSLTLFGMWREFSRHSLWHGCLPLWNPHLFCGLPLMLNGQATVLYPPSLVYWVMPVRLALVVDAMGHNLLLSTGGYVVGRALRLSRTSSLLIALVLGYGGAVSGHINNGHMTWHAARAWLPWEWWALLRYLRSGRRSSILLLASFFGLQAASGYPPLTLLGAVLCLGLGVAWMWTRHRRSASPLPHGWPTGLLLLIALGGGLAAVHVLPLLEISRLSSHGEMGYRAAVYMSGTWRTLFRLLLPDFFGGNTDIQWSIAGGPHEEIAYLGLLPIVLAVGAPWLCRARGRSLPAAVPWLWCLMPVGACLAMGDNTPVYHWLYLHSGILRLLRTPVRWIELTYLAAAILSGFAFEAAIHRRPPPLSTASVEYKLSIIMALLTGLMLMLLIVLFIPTSVTPDWAAIAHGLATESSAQALKISIELKEAALEATLTGLLMAAVIAVLLWSRKGAEPLSLNLRRRKEAWLVMVVAFDLLLSFWRGTKYMSANYTENSVVWPAALADHRPGVRYETAVPEASINWGMAAGVDTYNGYDAIASRDYYQFAGAVEGRKFWLPMYQVHRRTTLLRIAAVTHSLVRRKGRTSYGEEVLDAGQQGPWKLSRYPRAWPRAYLTNRLVRLPHEMQLGRLATIAAQPEWLPRPAVVASTDFPGLRYIPGSVFPTATPQEQTSGNQSLFNLNSPAPGLLVEADALYPGWHAWVDSAPAAIRPTNFLFRGVAVPRGRSTVRLAYEPESFRLGLFLSLAALAGLISCSVAGCSNRQPQRDS